MCVKQGARWNCHKYILYTIFPLYSTAERTWETSFEYNAPFYKAVGVLTESHLQLLHVVNQASASTNPVT